MAYIADQVRQLIAERAKHLCEYCQAAALVTGGPMHIEHIFPQSEGGSSDEDNLACSCARCNLGKGTRTHFIDPVTDAPATLYNPRTEHWPDHFLWSADKTRLIGLTPTGRATILALNINQPAIVMSRSLWVSLGVHPPDME